MENWIQIGNNQKNKTDRFREDERSYIVQGLVSVWITGKGFLRRTLTMFVCVRL